MKRQLLLTFILMNICFIRGFAADAVEINGVYYEFSESGAMVSKSPTEYSGDVYIPDYVEYNGQEYEVFTINAFAFHKCKNLTSIRLPGHLKSIATQAFQDCEGLTSITIPSTLEFVMTNAFYGCYSINKVHITDLSAWCKINFYGIESNPLAFAQHLYLNGVEVKNLVIPEDVTSIGPYTFSGDKYLKSVTFHERVKSIGNGSFTGCGFTSVTLPNSLESIGGAAFSHCERLEEIDIPENVTNIGLSAFSTCKSLSNVCIGAGVTNIGNNAFSYLSNLNRVECKALSVPETSDNAFSNTDIAKVLLVVPAQSAVAYQSASPWSGFMTEEDLANEIQSSDPPEPYAVLSSDKSVLTFFYDGYKNKRGGLSVDNHSWTSSANYIKKVVFDESFASCNTLTSTKGWFSKCIKLITIVGINNLKTDKVTNMSEMFFSCSQLEILDVSGFNTSKVTNMFAMFADCSRLTSLDVSSFDIKGVTDMSYMFYGCSNLETIYCDDTWNTATSSDDMFYYCRKCPYYDASKTSAAYAKSIVEGGYFTPSSERPAREPYAVLSDDKKTMTFYYDSNKKNHRSYYDIWSFTSTVIPWNDKVSYVTTAVFDNSFADYTSLTSTRFWFNGWTKLETIVDLRNLKTSNVTDMTNMFKDCYSLTSLDVSGFDTGKVTSMNSMFSGCSSLTSLDVSHFNTSNVKYMTGMFYNCSDLTSIDVSGFSTENAEDFNSMFSGCTSLTVIYCNDTWNSGTSTQMFYKCINLPGYSKDKDTSDYAKSISDGGYFTPTSEMHMQCAKPVITYTGSNLSFSCETEGVEFVYDVTLGSGKGNKVQLTPTVTVSVYATKEGLENSEVVTQEINISGGLKGDVNGDGDVDIADAVGIVNFIVGKIQALSRSTDRNTPEAE